MARFGFVGPTYQSSNHSADAQACENFYPERDEGGGGKADVVLQPCSGLQAFAKLSADTDVSSLYTFLTGTPPARTFAVGNSGNFYEIKSDGSSVIRGAVSPTAATGQIAANQTQLLILSNGLLYTYTLATNVLSAAIGGLALMSAIGSVDGYFVALQANTNKFQISALLDGSSWDPLDVAEVLYFPDNIISMVCHDHRDIIFFGDKQSVPYYNTGNPDFPFSPVPGQFIEMGSAATLGAIKLDNSVFWVAKDERGSMTAQRLNGYTPVRVSTHALEQEWQKYAVTSDLVSFTYQENGHGFWHIYFPTQNVSWVFDVAMGMWHKRCHLNNGVQEAHLAQCHTFNFGKHLVGSRNTGKVYWMSDQFFTDDGDTIRRVRRAPYVARENVYAFFNSLEIEGDWGNGPNPPLIDGNGNPRSPQLMLNWSDDRARTWSDEWILESGMQGDFGKRMIARQMGSCWGTIGRVFQIATTDPVGWRITDAFLDADPEYKSVERLSSQLRKSA